MSRKRTKPSSQTRRDAFDIANLDRLLASSGPLRSGRALLDIEDRRQFHPGVREPRTIRQVARVTMRPPGRPRSKKQAGRISLRSPEVIAFDLPRSTVVCVRRAIRKQVMHAKKVAGKSVRRPKRNALSKISCRRK